VDRIYDNNDLINIGEMDGLVNTISYHKKFCFSRCDVYFMMNYLDNWTVMDMNVRYQSGNIVLYTGIQYNNNQMRVCWWIKSDIVEFAQMSLNHCLYFFCSQHEMRNDCGIYL